MQGGNTDRSNEAWLEELRFGTESEAALADLRALLRRGLVKALGDRRFTDADVEDFVQNAMIRVLANLDTFRGESRFTTWAMAVAVRVALGELRKRRYRESRENTDPEVLEEAIAHTATDSDPSVDLDRKSSLARLRRAIRDELSERQRTVVLRELAGVPIDIIAEDLGVSRNALYKLHHDARRKLRKAMAAVELGGHGVRRKQRETSEG